MVRIAVLLLLAGCRQLLGFEELAEPSATDARTDGPDTDGLQADAPTDGSIGDGPGACPSNYTLAINNSFYRHVTNLSIPWLSAANDCANDGIHTHLVVLSDDLERDNLTMTTGAGIKWVGLSDRNTEGTYLTVTDEAPTYPPIAGAPWAAGEPSNAMEGEDCVLLDDGGALQDLACGNGRNFICECDGFPNDPTNF